MMILIAISLFWDPKTWKRCASLVPALKFAIGILQPSTRSNLPLPIEFLWTCDAHFVNIITFTQGHGDLDYRRVNPDLSNWCEHVSHNPAASEKRRIENRIQRRAERKIRSRVPRHGKQIQQRPVTGNHLKTQQIGPRRRGGGTYTRKGNTCFGSFERIHL